MSTVLLRAALALALLAVVLAAPAGARADLGPGPATAEAGPPPLPRVLGDADVRRYRQIFALGEAGDWPAVDALIAGLDDRVLVGHAMAQRYLHPTKYRSRYKELKAWMADYADHPDAPRLYKLALRRKPANWRLPRPPVRPRADAGVRVAAAAPEALPRRSLSAADRREARALDRRVRWYLRKGWTLAAKKVIRSDEARRLWSAAEHDRARARLAHGYFVDGRDEWAVEWAETAARSARWVPEANWTAGLANWRLGRLDDAARHFEAVAARADVSPWLVSASAFWAARAHLVDGRPAAVNRWLAVAAGHARTFYGLLARRVLGLETGFRWAPSAAEQAAVTSIAGSPRGRRAIALLEVGEAGRAARELGLLAVGADRRLARGIMALAANAGMLELAVKLDARLFPDGGGYDAAAYPMPRWAPAGGFRVDRALIFALIRQESRFNPRARSPAGARGLMQLMPRTASFVAGDRRYRGSKRKELFDPATNLALGQDYIEHLLADAGVGDDLFMLATAWNGGPGNLAKWRRRTDYMGDPLFFIESIPSRETRVFIERVLSNLWIYRDRLGQPAPSLDALAAGVRPQYRALDPQSVELARHGED